MTHRALSSFFSRAAWSAVALASAALASACGDDGADPPAPMVVNLFPAAGAGPQDRDVQPTVTFDAPLDITAGSVSGRDAGGDVVAGVAPTFSLDGFEVSVLPPGGEWPAGETITLTFTGLRGVSGGVAEDVTLTFRTLDDAAPQFLSFVPADRAVVSDVRAVTSIRITFDEPMNPDLGMFEVVEPTTLQTFDFAAREWLEGNTVLVVPRAGDRVLPYGTEFRINLSNFSDVAGNVAVERQYRFTTGPDTQAPRVVSAMPMEGQVDVDPQLTEIVVRFDEPIREDGQARLESSGELVGFVRGTREAGAQTLRFDLLGPGGISVLRTNAPHRLVLTGFRDLANNPPSADPMLGGDAALDFTTGPDLAAPTVRAFTATVLIEGIPTPVDLFTTGVTVDEATLEELVITFTEAMDTTTPAEFTFDDGTGPVVVPHEWRFGGAQLAFDTTMLEFGRTRTYAIELGETRDLNGNAFVPGDLLTDTAVRFTTAPPSGESCDEAFSVRDGARAGSQVTYTFAANQFGGADGGAAVCDEDGAGPDVVVAYEKTTPSVAADPTAGRILRVRAEVTPGTMGALYNLEVVAGACDADDDGFERLHCAAGRAVWERELDVGAGTYFIKVASAGTGFPAGTLVVEEVAAGREGESCLNPYDDTSAIYRAPAGPDGARWDIPSAETRGLDRKAIGGAVQQCDGAPAMSARDGVDAVIEYEKLSAASYLEIDVSAADVRVIVAGGCDLASSPEVFCGDAADSHTFRGGAFLPAGPVYLWIALDDADAEFPTTAVEIREVTLPVGEGCQNGNVISSAGTYTLPALDSTEGFDRPACFASGTDVEWFRYTPTGGEAGFAPNVPSAIAVVQQGTGRTLACDARLDDYALGRLVEAGETLCIAIPVGSSATSLTVTDRAYGGVEDDRSEVSVTYPAGFSLLGETFLANDDDTLYLGYFESGSAGVPVRVLEVPMAGGTARIRGVSDFVTRSTLGRAGVVADGRLFTTNMGDTGEPSRVFRFTFGSTWSGAGWDGTTPSTNDDFFALASNGGTLYYATRKSSTDTLAADTRFFSTAVGTSGGRTDLGANVELYRVEGLAADDTYLYVMGLLEAGDRPGVYRVPLSNPTASPTRLSPPLALRPTSLGSGPAALALDDLVDPAYLYVRSADPEGIHVIGNPDSSAAGDPVYLGLLSDLESTGDAAMTYDRAADALYVFVQTSPTPTFVKLQ